MALLPGSREGDFPQTLLEAIACWMDDTGTSSLTFDKSENKVTVKYASFERRTVDLESTLLK